MDETQPSRIPSSVQEIPARGDAFEAALARFNETMTGIREQAKHAAEYADEAVHKNPWRSIGLGFGIGVLVGALIAMAAGSRSTRGF
jgi:ElaB/YqjD/DUF883 family membrane-anchored ribosome-binding protein